MSKTILITGVPGVGKTSIAEKVSSKYTIPTINFGDVLFEKIKSENFDIEHVDEIREKLSVERYKEMQLATAQQIMEKEGDKIITSHLSIDTPIGFMPGFPQKIVDVLNPEIIFIIESPLEEIKKRRQGDGSERNRSHKLESWIDFHQKYNRSLAANFSFYTGNYCYPVMNRQGELEETFAEIDQVMSQFISK